MIFDGAKHIERTMMRGDYPEESDKAKQSVTYLFVCIWLWKLLFYLLSSVWG